MRAWLAVLPALFLALPGCQQLPEDEDDDGGSPSPSASTDGGTFLPGDEGQQDGADETGSMGACDPVAQTGCDSGEKCTAITSGGSVIYACAAAPGGLGPSEPCEASPEDGIDGCPAGYACVEDEAEAGLCVPLCESSGDCEQGECLPSLQDQVPYCADDCSPFEGQCPTPLACRRNEDRFSCSFLATNDVGGVGSVCAMTNDSGCAPGLVCVAGALVPNCTTDNCCALLCEADELDTCPSPTTCNELFLAPAPGFEAVGACFVPA